MRRRNPLPSFLLGFFAAGLAAGCGNSHDRSSGVPSVDAGPEASADSGGFPVEAGGDAATEADAGTCSTPTGSASLPIDASGWVPASSNSYGIQGQWTWVGDSVSGGKSTFTSPQPGSTPYVAGSGMCVSGSTPGGLADNYATWGANVTLSLNQSAPGASQLALDPAPACFTVTITGTGAPGGLNASLCPASSGAGTSCPQVDVGPGTNEVCLDNVVMPSWCATTTNTKCLPPSALAAGVQSLSIQGNAGDTGGSIDFCVTSVVPHGPLCGSDAGVPDGGSLPPIAEGQSAPGSFGAFDLTPVVFPAFSVVKPHERDPQVFDFVPDLLPRGWNQWDTTGLHPFDFDFTYSSAVEQQGTLFVGGLTATVLFPDQVSAADFLDEVSRDASNNPVVHPELPQGGYRGNIANPKFRQQLVETAEIQIDGGVTGLHFDEVLGGYTGASYVGGNEGFDDYDVADFGAYLCNKYAGSLSTLTGSLGVTAADKLDCTGASGGRSFDYRGYIARHGAQSSPLGAQNPLAPDWGTVVNNRATAPSTFLSTYPAYVYWQQIVLALRTYARQKYNREILISANGILPFVDFQTIGIYTPNQDGPGGTSFDWMPVKNGDLDGTQSFKATLESFKTESKQVLAATGANEVPMMLFLDYPTPSLDRYYALPLQEKEDYFRLYAAEAYALGIWFAVPLEYTSDLRTATSLGMLDFFKQLKSFYKGHADVYQGAHELAAAPTVSAPGATTVLNALPDGRTVLHIINHAYSAGVIPQQNVTAAFPVAAAPTTVTLVSPDFTADQPAQFTYANGTVTVSVGELDAYVAVVVQ